MPISDSNQTTAQGICERWGFLWNVEQNIQILLLGSYSISVPSGFQISSSQITEVISNAITDVAERIRSVVTLRLKNAS